MAKNKVTIDGTTIIDLSTTDIESAADIPAGKVGYLRTGERVTGTGENMSSNPLNGKILAVTGDSICMGVGYSGGYAGIIGIENDMTVQNIAEGGGSIMYESGSFCISTSIADMRADADYVIMEGGVNDSGREYPLGQLTEGYAAALNTSTFAGAVEQMFKSAVARFPSAKLGFIIVHKCHERLDSNDTNSYYNILVNACKKWGIPYCDLNSLVPPLGLIDALKNAYTDEGDGYHPNEQGYRIFYVPKITAWMKGL